MWFGTSIELGDGGRLCITMGAFLHNRESVVGDATSWHCCLMVAVDSIASVAEEQHLPPN